MYTWAQYVNSALAMCMSTATRATALRGSSCEAELLSYCSLAVEAMHIKHVIRTLTSAPARPICRVDSSSSIYLFLKSGVSKVRHLNTELLWLQRATSEKKVELGAVLGGSWGLSK